MDINDKVARCRLFASLVVADDLVEDAELLFLERQMGQLELTEEEKAAVMVLLDEDQALEAISDMSDEDKQSFLNDLAELAWIDDDLDDYEVEQIGRVAAAMGLGGAEVDKALDRAEANRG